MLSIDLVEHFDDEVCSRRIGPDRVAISVKVSPAKARRTIRACSQRFKPAPRIPQVQPIKDVSKAKMCTGDGGTWERLFKKK
eukprot:scaffold63_cov306-Pinguiococcus_pyrenoidosus.AAC.19